MKSTGKSIAESQAHGNCPVKSAMDELLFVPPLSEKSVHAALPPPRQRARRVRHAPCARDVAAVHCATHS